MPISVTRTSSKGQVVIPKEIRDDLGLEKGTLLLTYTTGDRIVLKKLSEPEKGIFAEITEPIREKIKKLGIEKEDIEEAINEAEKAKK